MRRSNGYGSYRGRRSGAVRAVLIGIVVCLLLLICAFFIMSRFLVFTGDGARLDIPFFHRDKPKDDDVGLVIDGTPTPGTDIVVEGRTIKAVMLPVSALTDGTAADLLKETGATAAVFDMKTDEGMLGYVSALREAINAKTSQSDPALNAAISAGNSGELYSIARVSCFRDQLLSTHRLSFSVIGTSGYRWKDSGGSRWVSPASQGASDYLLGVVEELCMLGFDEILLDNCAFPVDEETSIQAGITYPATPDERTETVRLFLEAVKAITDKHNVKLSIRTTGAAIEGQEGETTGLLPAALLASGDKLWVDQADIAAGVRGQSVDSDRLVAVLPAGTDTASVTEKHWAVLEADTQS